MTPTPEAVPTAARLRLAVELSELPTSEPFLDTCAGIADERDTAVRIASDALDECQRLERIVDAYRKALGDIRDDVIRLRRDIEAVTR